ncbi:unnamed protein product [Adineta steineri]|nr:unnamed protein product [Adineta steineri]
MSNFDNSSYDFLNHESINTSIDELLSMSNISLDPYLESSPQNNDFPDILTSTFPFPSDITNSRFDTRTPSGFSPQTNSNSNSQELPNVYEAVALPSNMQSNPNCIEVIAQPFYTGKLRYRSDFDQNEHRLGTLKNRSKNSNYNGPAIRIPKGYRNPNESYYIRVCHVTVIHNQTNVQYIHPYILEHPLDEGCNDRPNNAVDFPIEQEDCRTGIKSFPLIRIVKLLDNELKNLENLRVFDYQNQNLHNTDGARFTSARAAKKDYDLKRSQLAFAVIKKTIINGQIMNEIFPQTTALSDEMIENENSVLDAADDDDNQSLNKKVGSSSPICRVLKYAPHYGFDTSIDEIVIILSNKLEPKTYGPLKITFECDTSKGRWSQPISEVNIKDRIISFKTPIFPYPDEESKVVDIVLRQDTRDLETLKYYYISSLEPCSRCHLLSTIDHNRIITNTPNKRPAYSINSADDTEYDGVVPVSENPNEREQLRSESSHESLPSSPPVSTAASLPTTSSAPINGNYNDKFMDILSKSVESLFQKNDYTQLLRICRTFIKKKPQLLHDAVTNNHSDLLLKFIPISTIDMLQEKNKTGENVLLHAIRLNHVEIVKILLEKENAEALIYNKDEKNNNIFHIIASNSTSVELCDFIINYLLKKTIPIQEKFDHYNQDHRTPIQLCIIKNNLLLTKHLLKYFKTNVYETQKRFCDNLIHLAVRFGDLEMVKYLIEDGELNQLGNQSNLTMTPSELAQSLERHDIAQYLNVKYPPPQISEDTSSSSDDDD